MNDKTSDKRYRITLTENQLALVGTAVEGMMNDLISRKALCDYALNQKDKSVTPNDIMRFPSAQPEQRWIPCSERLPEKDEYGKVLVTYILSGGTLWTTVIIAHYSDLMGIAKPSFHIGNVGKNDFINITEQVTAWMPLPEPYKEEQE